jgi:5-methylcytosine-specific restriction protein A
MPPRPKKPCKHCKKPTDHPSGYCEDCAKHRISSDKRYDMKRGTPAERGYDSRWKKVRERYLRKHPFCEECEKTTPFPNAANEVHHIVPINEGGKILDENNLMALCKSCHSKITSDYRKGKGSA